MSWWIDNNGVIHQATAAVANKNAWFGPYPTKAAAQAALHGGTGGSGDPWWIEVPNIALPGDHQPGPTYVQAPSPGPTATGNISEVFGPYPTKKAAEAAYNGIALAKKKPSSTQNTSPLAGLAAIGDFFSRLSHAATWVRVGEVVLGILLLGVGIARITGVENFASKAAKSVKVIPI